MLELVLWIILAIVFLGFAFPFFKSIFRVTHLPAGMGLLKSMPHKLSRQPEGPFENGKILDSVVLTLRESKHSILRLTGSLLQTCELRLTQESMSKELSFMANPLKEIHLAIKNGDRIALIKGWTELVESIPSHDMIEENWDLNPIELLHTIANKVEAGNRSKWGLYTEQLSNRVNQFPRRVQPVIHILISFLERPIKYTEVCVDTQKLKYDRELLARLTRRIAENISKDDIDEVFVLNALGTYDVQYQKSA